jgi:hypothetical protein
MIRPRSIRRLRARNFLSVVRCSLRGMTKLGDFTTAHTLSDQEIVSGLAHVDATEKYLAAAKMAMLAAADRRRLAKKLGQGSVKRWYANAVRIPEFKKRRKADLPRILVGRTPNGCRRVDRRDHPCCPCQSYRRRLGPRRSVRAHPDQLRPDGCGASAPGRRYPVDRQSCHRTCTGTRTPRCGRRCGTVPGFR